jgi:hypothetical protein
MVTSDAVADRLLALSAFCVVVDKAAGFPARLINAEKGFPNAAHLCLYDMAPSQDGAAPALGPWSSFARARNWGRCGSSADAAETPSRCCTPSCWS